MAKKAAVKFDKNGLSSLGAEKLAEILLEEAASNKPLKLRLQTALAGGDGAGKISALIDKRLDQIEKSKTGITRARSKDLALELGGLVRTINAELGSADSFAASERMLRLVAELPQPQQVSLVPLIEKCRSTDVLSEQGEVFINMMNSLCAEAGEVWKALLAKVPAKHRTYPAALGLLQVLALKLGDFKDMGRLEEAKPEMFQNSLHLAQLLFEAEQFEEALVWVRRKPKGMHMIYVNGIRAAVGPDYGARERKLLEAGILDRLKRRDEAQKLRWDEFCESFDVDILRQYISKLDDFAEFDEMDRAMALVMQDKNIYKALHFLVQWPKLDLAAQYIIDHAKDWDGRYYELLSEVSTVLHQDYPLATTVLNRALVTDILNRNLSSAYDFAVVCLAELEEMSSRIAGEPSLPSHEAFMQTLRVKHGKKYSFWGMVPIDFR